MLAQTIKVFISSLTWYGIISLPVTTVFYFLFFRFPWVHTPTHVVFVNNWFLIWASLYVGTMILQLALSFDIEEDDAK